MTAQDMIDAVKAGDATRVAELLAAEPGLAGARLESGESAVLVATYYGRRDIAGALLAAGVELSVFEAAAAGRAERVAELLAAEPGLARAYSHDGWTALHLAAFFGSAPAAAALLAAGADAHAWSRNGQANQPLHAAAAGDHADVVALLVAAGADVRSRSAEGFTALHAAAQNGSAAIARALLDAGAEPLAATAGGRTPLDLAVEAGRDDVAAMLRAA